MMYSLKKRELYGILVIAFFALSILFIGSVNAQNPFNIEFPIPELGNCSSIEDCRAYCDEPTNGQACFEWAQDQGIDVGSRVEVPNEGGPGGCRGHEECEAYCSQPTNEVECIEFAVESGHITPEEAQRALRGGPGGCRGEEECDAFCSQPANDAVCIEFAVENGRITSEEAQRALRGGPGGCRGHEECEAYCMLPEHSVECLQSAVEDGFMTQTEANQILTFINAGPGFSGPQGFTPIGPGPIGPGPGHGGPDGIDVEKALRIIEELGGGPGGCQNFQECDVFCSQLVNDDECFDFALKHELMDPDQIEKFKKLENIVGPGGCRGRECEAYCEAPGREQECLDFAHDQGFISDAEFEEISRFVNIVGPGGCRGRECEQYCEDPTRRDECFAFAKANNLIPPEELERIEKFRRIEEKVEAEGGPGGCRGEVECHTYCSDPTHLDECVAFAVNEGLLDPEEAQRALRQFIEIDQFGPGGFGPQGFGPGGSEFGEGDFPPGFENIPPEFRDRFESEFEARFQQFEQFRGGFERGDIPQRRPEDFASQEGFDNFFGFGRDDGSRQEFGGGGFGEEASITINREPSGEFKFFIRDREGILEFAFDPASGSRYSGTLAGCPVEHTGQTAAFAQMQLPFTATIIDCEGNEFTTIIRSLEDFDSSRSTPFPVEERDFPSSGEFPEGSIPEGFIPEGFGVFPAGGDFPRPGEFLEEFIPEGFGDFPQPGDFPRLEDFGDFIPEDFSVPQEFLLPTHDGEFDSVGDEGFVPPETFIEEQFIQQEFGLQTEEEFRQQFEQQFLEQSGELLPSSDDISPTSRSGPGRFFGNILSAFNPALR